MNQKENKEMWSICGGKYCKKSGCNYASKDFNSWVLMEEKFFHLK